MERYRFTGILQTLITRAESGTQADVDFILGYLTSDSTFAMTRYVDYALSLVTCPVGSAQIRHYLFNGTQIQRNYASLYFNRLGERDIVREAYALGLIDEIQAFAR